MRAVSPVRQRRQTHSLAVLDTASTTGVDQLLADIADYVVSYDLQSPDAVKNARYSLLDALGACALLCDCASPVNTTPTPTLSPQAARCWR